MLIAMVIAWSIALFQYSIDREKYIRLRDNGTVVPAISSYSKDWTGDYANFYFITMEGTRIEKSQKCGSKETFDKEYANMLVIYNPKNPKEFENFYDFNNYFGRYRVFFFLFLYPFLLTMFLLMGLRVIKGLYLFYKPFLGKSRLPM